MTLVVDASAAVAAALASTGQERTWALEQLAGDALVAPELLPQEVANILRRLEIGGELDATAATLAGCELLELPIELHPWSSVAERAWALRGAVTAYDAAYLALAEAFDAPLLTLDRRLSGPGPELRVPAPSRRGQRPERLSSSLGRTPPTA